MKVLELMHALEEAYDRFGDIEVIIETKAGRQSSPNELIIESEEFIIKYEG
jgi:hypothetical protein